MLNVIPGKKIADYCKADKCPIYETIICLSNNGDLKGPVRCPKIFCERFNKKAHVCKKCGIATLLTNGYFNKNNEFECYKCPEQKKIKLEKKEEPIEDNDIVGKFKNIENLMVELTKNKKFTELYLDKKSVDIIFYNPFNLSPNPLVWPKKYFIETDLEALKKEITEFFKSYIAKFKEESCKGCVLEPSGLQNLSCLDCARNKQSPSMVKVDRYKAG